MDLPALYRLGCGSVFGMWYIKIDLASVSCAKSCQVSGFLTFLGSENLELET